MGFQLENTDPGGSNPYAACLSPLLDALGWRGEQSKLLEMMPHFLQHDLDLESFRGALANLRFVSMVREMPLKRMDLRLLPCLFVPDHRAPMVLMHGNGEQFLAFDGGTQTFGEIQAGNLSGLAVFFSPISDESPSLLKRQKGWFARVMARFKGPVRMHVLISLLLTLLAFATPLFIMTIYNQLPFLDSPLKLLYLVTGVAVFLGSDFGLKTTRLWLASRVSARMGYIVSNEMLRRILYLPPPYTEAASISAQNARIKDFDSVREFIGSPAATALVDLPFVALLLLGLYLMAGHVALVPLTAMALFAVLAWGMRTKIKQAAEEDAEVLSRRQETLIEALSKLRTIKASGSRSTWLERLRTAQASLALSGYRNAQLSALMDTLTNFLVMAAGVGTLAVAVSGVIQGTMSMGAMIGAKFLVWRILAPLRSGFTVMMQLDRIRKSVAQLDKFMTFEVEDRTDIGLTMTRRVRGEIAFSRVSLRYQLESQPVLLGVDLSAGPGRCLLISGHDGAGKSSVLKLILGMYTPQAGRISLDGVNVRQYDPAILRQLAAYAPEFPQFFHGTIAQNLDLASPGVSPEEMRTACAKAGVIQEIEALPAGLETRLGDFKAGQLSFDFHRRLAFARALIRSAPLLLVDQVLDKLDAQALALPLETLREAREQRTLILVSNNPRLFTLAHTVLWLEGGRVRRHGPAQEVIPTLSRQSFCEGF